MKKCLVIFHHGKITMLLEAAGVEFDRAVKLWFAENRHKFCHDNGDEAWLLPASAFHEAIAEFAGDTFRQMQAIRKADKAIEAEKYLLYHKER